MQIRGYNNNNNIANLLGHHAGKNFEYRVEVLDGVHYMTDFLFTVCTIILYIAMCQVKF